MRQERLKAILEAALLAAGKPLRIDAMLRLFAEEADPPAGADVANALTRLREDCAQRGIELKEVASGYRFQVKHDYAETVARLWDEKPPRYSRALLETLALIAYRQPVTRAEIEDVRGVAVSSRIIKTLLERDWIQVIGRREVPGRPALYATTRGFLDYFNLISLDELPSLKELQDIDATHPLLQLENSEPGEETAH